MARGGCIMRLGLSFFLLIVYLYSPVFATCEDFNKVVLVTGSGSGIGKATALEFARNGADISIVEINEETANETAEEIRKLGRKALVVKTDVTKTDEAKNAIEKTIETFGKLDVLVNNAGILRPGNLLSGNIMDSYDLVLNVNLRSVVLMTSLAVPYLMKSKGCIINVSSVIGAEPRIAYIFPAYAISKAGVSQFTRVAAAELGPSGVRVNAVAPGVTRTNIYDNSGIEGDYSDTTTGNALGKIAYPPEIADLIYFLASDKAKSITGSVYTIDNGMSVV